MESTKLSATLFLILLFTSTPALACGTCPPIKPPAHHHHKPIKPPVILPPIIKPPVTLPPITKPPVTVPPITVPPITVPPITVPPITVPPVLPLPPVFPTPPVVPGGCPPPPAPPAATCPADSLKLGACVDVLGLVHGVIGDPVVNHCCPVLGGLVELEAAVCLCTHIKLKLLDINIYLPIALKLLLTCGKTPPAGFTCPA